MNYALNGLGQATQVFDTLGGITYATGATYHPNGQLAGFTYGNGIVHSLMQTLRGLPSQSSDGTIVQDTYTWDQNANLTSLIDTRSAVFQVRTRAMTYDARDRLWTTTYGYNGRVATFGYDVLDNLRTTSETASGRNHRYEYATDGRLTRIVDPAAPSVSVIGYSYDARGNTTSRTSATGFVPNTTSIVADEANRVQSMTTGGAAENYTYDGHGRRTRVTISGTTNMHFYTQAGRLLAWENPATATTIEKSRNYHIYLGDKRIARKQSANLAYVHTDHLGSLLALTTVAPATLLSSNPIWEPWGAPVGGGGLSGIQYADHYRDSATGLSYMQQRYYDPYAARFLAVDPVAASPGSFNRYWYANNNPYKYVDPDGRQSYGYGTNQPAQILDCHATGTCDPTGARGDEIVASDAKTIVGAQLAIASVAGAAAVASPAAAAVAPAVEKNTIKYVLCGVLSLCGKDKAGEVADDIKRLKEIAQRIAENQRKTEKKIEPPPPEPKLPAPSAVRDDSAAAANKITYGTVL